jgi:hypothetical protein
MGIKQPVGRQRKATHESLLRSFQELPAIRHDDRFKKWNTASIHWTDERPLGEEHTIDLEMKPLSYAYIGRSIPGSQLLDMVAVRAGW